MPAPSFAHVVDGSLTGLTKVSVARAVVYKRFGKTNVTGSGDGAAASFSTNSRRHWYLSGVGWFVTGTAPNVYAKPPNAATVVGSPWSRIALVNIRKAIQIFNVTAAADAQETAYFEQGVKVYAGRCQGELQDTETPINTEDGEVTTLTFPVTGALTVTGAAVFDYVSSTMSFPHGGPVKQDCPFSFSGAVTATNTPLANDTMAAVLALDNGETMTGTVKLDSIQISVDYRSGATIGVSYSGPFSGEVTFA